MNSEELKAYMDFVNDSKDEAPKSFKLEMIEIYEQKAKDKEVTLDYYLMEFV